MTQRDKRSMAVLGCFLAATAYYLLVLDPLTQRQARLQKEFGKAAGELRDTRRKAAEYRGWKEEFDKFAQQAADLKATLNENLLKDNPDEVLRGLLNAAADSGVRLGSLTPQVESYTVPETLEEREVNTYNLAGTGSRSALLRFLQRLGGLELAYLDLREGAGQARQLLDFNLRLKQVDAKILSTLELPPPSPEAVAAEARTTAAPASPPEPTPVPPPPPELPAGPPPPGPDISGLSLVGIAALDGRPLAALRHGAPPRCEYFWEGDAIGPLVLGKIDADGVTFADDGGRTARLELPTEKVSTADPDSIPQPPSAPAPAARRQGRLGLVIQALTAELAQARGLPPDTGVLVVTGRPDTTAIRAGDVLTKINGVPVSTLHLARDAMAGVAPGDEVGVELQRDGAAVKTALPALE